MTFSCSDIGWIGLGSWFDTIAQQEKGNVHVIESSIPIGIFSDSLLRYQRVSSVSLMDI